MARPWELNTGKLACKPGSVLNGHLSAVIVTYSCQASLPGGKAGSFISSLFGLTPGGVYLAVQSPELW